MKNIETQSDRICVRFTRDYSIKKRCVLFQTKFIPMLTL